MAPLEVSRLAGPQSHLSLSPLFYALGVYCRRYASTPIISSIFSVFIAVAFFDTKWSQAVLFPIPAVIGFLTLLLDL